MTSTVTAFGASRPLREGEIESEQDPIYGDAGARRWYVGGQSDRARAVAMHALENLLDGPEGYRVNNVVWDGLPSHCASFRYGNCLSFELLTPSEYAHQMEVFGAVDDNWRCECGDLNQRHEAFCYRCGAGQPEEDSPETWTGARS